MQNDDILTVKELADYLKIAEKTAYRFASEGKVPGFKVGSAWRFRKSEIDRWIAEQIGPSLRERGILFAGLDVIGDYLTEINVTSPTCIRELNNAYDLDIAGKLMDAIEQQLNRS